ncbi:MAG: branched-chain amino acid ABC transporter permease [Ilumatobacteraceae bacterium]
MRSGLFAETYRQDMALRRGSAAHAGMLVIAALAVLWPLVLSPRWQVAGVFALLAAMAAMGLHITTGLAGQVSLGHAAFVSIGVYTAIYLGVDQNLSWWVWLPASGLVAALVGAVIGPFALRLRGLYLAVVTVALLAVTQFLWAVWPERTGGFNGRSTQQFEIFGHNLFDRISVFGLVSLNPTQQFWFVCLVVLTVVSVAARNLQRTKPGRGWASVRDRDLAAAVAGVPITRAKISAFVVGAFYGGLAGALIGAYQSYVVPDQFGLDLSVKYIAIIVIGGLGSVSGVIVGAFFVTVLPLLVNGLTGLLPFLSTKPSTKGGLTVDLVATFLYGLAIVVVLVVEPQGLMGLWQRFRNIWRTWPWSR